MPLVDILQKILSDAESLAEEKREFARLRTAEIEKETAEKISHMDSVFSQERTEKGEKIRKKAQSLAFTSRKTLVSEAKRKVFSDILHEAQRAFSQISEPEREEMYGALLQKIPMGIKGKLFPAHRETEVLVRAAKKVGIDCTFENEITEERGGFLFSSPLLDADARLSLLLEKEVFPKIEKKLSAILFSE